jgi:hypothetical protein
MFALAMAVGGLLLIPFGSSAQSLQFQEKAPVGSPDLTATAAQTPAGSITVTYKNGELGIEAHDTTLSHVLHVVSDRIGASLNIPSGTDEPMSGIVGPGNVRDVLSSLLSGSHFNYALMGPPDDAYAVTQIFLYPKTATAVTVAQKKEENMPGQHADTAQAAVRSPPASVTATSLAPPQPKQPSLQRTEDDDDVKAAIDSLRAELSVPGNALASLGLADKLNADMIGSSDQAPMAERPTVQHPHRRRGRR